MARRALLTENERDALRGEKTDNARYVAVSRVRKKIDEELTTDVEVLREHDQEHGTDLLEKLRHAVANDIATGGSSTIDAEPGKRRKQPEYTPEEPDSGDATPGVQAGETGFQNKVRNAVADVEFPTTRDRDECIAAIAAAYAYLRENERATMREIVAAVLPEHPIGYDVPDLKEGERYRGAWWRRVVKPGLEALEDVEKPPTGGSDWTYTG